MNELMFTIYDEKARRYLPPFLSATSDTAIRMLKAELLKNAQGVEWDDLVLCEVGLFNIGTGLITANDEPNVVMRLSDLKKQIIEEMQEKLKEQDEAKKWIHQTEMQFLTK